MLCTQMFCWLGQLTPIPCHSEMHHLFKVHIFFSPCLSLCPFFVMFLVCSSTFPHFLLFSPMSTFLHFISPHILNTFFPSLLFLSHIWRHFILCLAPYVICPLIMSLYFCSLQQITYHYNAKYVSFFFSTLYGLLIIVYTLVHNM